MITAPDKLAMGTKLVPNVLTCISALVSENRLNLRRTRLFPSEPYRQSQRGEHLEQLLQGSDHSSSTQLRAGFGRC